MVQSDVPTKAITKHMRRSTAKALQSMDVQKLKIRREAEERDGWSEEELPKKVLGDLQSRDPDAFVHVDVRNNKICVITLITSAMKKNFSDNPTVNILGPGKLGSW